MTKPRVLVAYPCGGSVHPAFCKSICDLFYDELSEPSPDYSIEKVEYSSSLYVQENRNLLVDLAREKGVDWLLQLDTDESFKPDLLRQLMRTADAEKRPIVFGIYSNAQMAPREAEGAFYFVDMVFREVQRDEVDERGKPLHAGEYANIIPPSDRLPFEIDAAGSGILLTHMSVFDRMDAHAIEARGEVEPWFWLELIQPEGRKRPQIMNEDIAFSRKAREAGLRLWCDPQAEAIHHKTLALLPSSFRRFMERARAVESEMARL